MEEQLISFETAKLAKEKGCNLEPKQETLEEAAKRCFEEMKILNPRGSIKEFIRMAVNFGAKWQQERMYSEEEVLKIIDLLFHKYASSFRVDAKEDFLLSKKK